MKKSFFASLLSVVLLSSVTVFAAGNDSMAQKAGNIVNNVQAQAKNAAQAVEKGVKDVAQKASDAINEGLDSLDEATKPVVEETNSVTEEAKPVADQEQGISAFFKRITTSPSTQDIFILIGGVIVVIAFGSFLFKLL